jgi:CheY-like chemotaxis protein
MLAIVTGSLDMAKRRLKGSEDPKIAVSLDAAAEGARRAAVLTQRLLAFSRQQPLEPKALDANRLVSGMSELLRRTIGENIAVETVLGGGLWPCFADAAQLENALINLAVNARDAMPEGGRLTIETANAHLDELYVAANADAKPGQYVQLGVTDTGSGMTQEVIERAFDPFYTTKGPGHGTGLGLSQVFGYVKQSGGHVKIYSEPGQGTTIKLYMPRHHGPAAGVEERAPSGALPQGRPDQVILVVEDEEQVRAMTVEALRELGYSVVQAPDGTAALARLWEMERVDLLFTDVVMPGMNGRELADRVRAERPDTPVLFTTGYTRNAVVHNGMLDPGVAFLAKPFTVEQLARKVAEAIGNAG